MSKHSDEEKTRLAALRKLAILDTPEEFCYNDIVEIAASICDVPMSLVTFVDAERQWHKANIGLRHIEETPREATFCSYAIHQDGIFEINDASQDSRFVGNPLVADSPNVRFYAGATLRLSNGENVGTLCVMDNKPKLLSSIQRRMLSLLSTNVVNMLESRRATNNGVMSEAWFLALGAATSSGIFCTTADGACIYTNERWQEIFSLNFTEALGFGWSSTVHPDDKDAVFTNWQHTSATGADFEMNFRIKNPGRRTLSVRTVSRPVLTLDGEVSGHVGTVEDITHHVRQDKALENANERVSIATESGNIGVWDWNAKTNDVTWTPKMFSLYGLPREINKKEYSPWADSVHPGDKDAVELANRIAIESDAVSFDSEFRIIWPDGSVHHIRAAANITRDIHGTAIRILGVNWDVTPIRLLSGELARQHELLQVTLQSIGDAVITTDTHGSVTWLNPVAEDLTGWSAQQAIGEQISIVFNIINESTRRPASDPTGHCMDSSQVVRLACNNVLISRTGLEFGVEDSAAPIRSKSGELLGAVLVFHDVSEQRQLTNEMKYRAMHDMLTGLVNRSEFESRLQIALNSATKSSISQALLYVDLDQFKLVNDSCGHPQGDQLLIRISKLMSSIVRREDTVARIGGDEFALILKDCDIDQARQTAQVICDSMSDFIFIHNGRRFRIGTSIGVVCLDQGWTNIEAVMQAADLSCYAAKEDGRNRVHVWHDTDASLLERRESTEWRARIEQALEEDRFELHAQHINPTGSDNDEICIEILIRLRDDDGKLLYPNHFIAAAERFNLATRIDRWVLHNTIENIKNLLAANHVNTLFINLSGQSVGDRVFHADAIKLLTEAGPDICQMLCLEITETAAITNMTEASVFVNDVRKLGVMVALDDFGAGASSFGYLKTLTVDIIKIDGQFIEGIVGDPLNNAAVRCFVDVANVMGIKTIAEYVSDATILKCVTDIGVDYAQGFHIHRPEPIEQVLSLYPMEALATPA